MVRTTDIIFLHRKLFSSQTKISFLSKQREKEREREREREREISPIRQTLINRVENW